MHLNSALDPMPCPNRNLPILASALWLRFFEARTNGSFVYGRRLKVSNMFRGQRIGISIQLAPPTYMPFPMLLIVISMIFIYAAIGSIGQNMKYTKICLTAISRSKSNAHSEHANNIYVQSIFNHSRQADKYQKDHCLTKHTLS